MDKFLRNRLPLCLAVFLTLLLSGFSHRITGQPVDDQYLAGCAYSIKGEYGKAVDCFSLAIMRNNSDAQLYILRGSSLLYTHDIDQAIADFAEANLIIPQVADIWLARAYALSGDAEKAIETLKGHLNSSFRLSEDSIKKDPAFDNLQQTSDWHALWQQDWYTEAEKAIAEVQLYARKKHFDQALSLLDEEIVRSSRDAKLFFTRGKVYYEQGNYGAAVADFSAAIQTDKSFIGVYAQRGMAHLGAENYKAAESDLSRALRSDPASFQLYVYRAMALAGQHEWQAAVKDMLLYMKYFDKDLKALYQCGEYYFAAQDYINALKCFNRNLKEDPNNGMYYKARGKTYMKTATYKYAMSDLSMSLDLLPNDAETWMYLGLCKIYSGDKENGCSDLEKARKMGNTEALGYSIESCQ